MAIPEDLLSVLLFLLGIVASCPTGEHVKQIESVSHLEIPFGMTFPEAIGGIVVVATVEDEWLREYAGFEKGRGHHEEPIVVCAHPAVLGKRQGCLENFSLKAHATADVSKLQGVACKTFVGTAQGVERLANDVLFCINKFCIRYYEICFFQCFKAGGYLVREPNVVLVAKEDDISFGLAEGMFKIADVATLALVAEDAYLRESECSHYIECGVVRLII